MSSSAGRTSPHLPAGDCRAYGCGGGPGGGGPGGGGAGGGQVRRGRICPQFRPILQSQTPAWGWAASQQSSGDGGVGSTVVGEGSALVSGTLASPTPPSAMASTAAPPHAAVIVLRVRSAMTPNSNFSALNVQSRDAALLPQTVFPANLCVLLNRGGPDFATAVESLSSRRCFLRADQTRLVSHRRDRRQRGFSRQSPLWRRSRCHRSGRRSRVRCSEACRRQASMRAWSPDNRVSGTSSPRQLGGRV
jgi:hypothetical protein